MRMPSVIVTATPSSYEEMMELYYDYVVGLVRKLGIPPQEADDVTQDILLAEFKADILAMYDPAHTVEHQGKVKNCTFRAFLSARVALRCRGKRDQVNRRLNREVLTCDKPMDENGTRWIELFGPGGEWDDYSEIDNREFIDRMRSYLATVPRAPDKCDLLALFDELYLQLRERGEISGPLLQARFGVSEITVSAWLARLREIMSGAGDLPRPEKCVIGGMTMSLADIRWALDILRGAKGIMVAGPLAKAGHPLVRAEDRWYHQFARDEIRLYPELKTDPQTHKTPAGHVKLAVLHGLERMLGIGMADADAPPGVSAGSVPAQSPQTTPDGGAEVVIASLQAGPDAPLDLIEAKIWALGGTAADVDEVLAWCDQLTPVPAACY
jgi:hypothetical protein